MRAAASTAILLATSIGLVTAQKPVALETVRRAFHEAGSVRDVAAAVKQVLASGAPIDEVRAQLQAGRGYAPRPAGRIVTTSIVNGLELDNTIEIPAAVENM